MLYNNCDLLYFASTKEGFGLPILEAQSCGLPVLTSNITAMPYVAGDGALFVNPYSVEEIKKGICEIRESTETKRKIISNGYENIDRFSEEKFVSEFIELYKTL
jgi:glycosyltransferase involved in cell wall biosynthesis